MQSDLMVRLHYFLIAICLANPAEIEWGSMPRDFDSLCGVQ